MMCSCLRIQRLCGKLLILILPSAKRVRSKELEQRDTERSEERSSSDRREGKLKSKNVNVNVYLPEEEKILIKKWAKMHGISVSELARRAVKFYIKEEIMKEKEKRRRGEKVEEEQVG